MTENQLPEYNERVVIKVLMKDGTTTYRVETRDRPQWQKEYRTLVYDPNDFMLDKRHEAQIVAWARVPADDSDKWLSPARERPAISERVLCLVLSKVCLLYPSVRYRTCEGGDGNDFGITSFDERIVKWTPLEALQFIDITTTD